MNPNNPSTPIANSLERSQQPASDLVPLSDQAAVRLQESEERYRLIAETANEGIWLIDLDARTTFVNHRMAEMLGCTPEEMTGSRVMDFVFPDDLLLATERIEQNLQGRSEQFDFRFRRRDGREVLVLAGSSPVINGEGKLVGALGLFSDITARKSAERELERTNSILNAVFNGTTDAIFVKDRAGRYVMINKTGADIIGRPPAEIVGKTDLELLSPAEAQQIMLDDQRVLVKGTPHSFENVVKVDGLPRTFNAVKAPYLDPQGNIIGLIGISRDITTSKETSEAISRLAAIVENSDDAIVGESLDGTIESWNPAAERLLGYKAAEVIGKPIWIIYPPDHGDEFASIIGRLRRGEHIDHYETVRVHKDGTRIDVSVSISPIKDESGRIIGASKIARDMTERRRQEQAQHFLASASGLLASSLDYETTLVSLARLAVPFLADWCIVYMVAADGDIRRLAMEHAVANHQELTRQIENDFRLDPDSPIGVPKVLRTGEPEFYPNANAQILAADAQDAATLARLTEPLDVRSWMCVPLMARGTLPLGAISFISTGSSRRYSIADLSLAQELARRAALAIDNAQLYREAQQAIRLRDQFLSIASHELKTPLTALLGYTELLQRSLGRGSQLDPHDQRALDTIYQSSLRLNKLISSLLDISRIQEGRFSIEREPVDLNVLIERLLGQVRPTLNRHELVYSETESPVIVQGDELRLEQVFQNLIQNAIKYSVKGGAIRLRLEQEEGMACFSISDSGIGIPASALPHLFSRFYRADNAEMMHISGMGIGLYVVEEIVSLHGGSVEVSSVEGKGSTFTVRLPLMKNEVGRGQ